MSPRKSFLLRIEPALYQELECWAQQELRSVNGQIEYLLKQAVARRKGGKTADELPPSETQNSQALRAPEVTDQAQSDLASPEGDG
ncbi:MAG TPA: hypothetical protein VG826_08010 [Pirellulales bacterium]|nr:hypothetical protein [Pirellulales bacterium]